eukprot:11174204-Lingulodinium_polyedra.AAC.1
MAQMEEQRYAERLGFEERATAEEHAEEVEGLLCHLQDATMNCMRVIEEASELRHQVTDVQAALREAGVREHAN